MPECASIIGVKNISITFRDCDTNQVYGPIIHELAGEQMPMWKTCRDVYTPLPGGYVSKRLDNVTLNMEVIRDYRIPLSLYQGCAALDVSVEYENGMVITALNGQGTGENQSDTHTVTIDAIFREADELLPAGTLDPEPLAA